MLLSRLVCVQFLFLFPFSCMDIFSIWSLQLRAISSLPVHSLAFFSHLLCPFDLPSIHSPIAMPQWTHHPLLSPFLGRWLSLSDSIFIPPSVSQSIFISLISARLHLLVTFPYFQLASYFQFGMFSLPVHSSRNVSMCHWHLLQLQTSPPLSICLPFHSQFIKLTVPWRSLFCNSESSFHQISVSLNFPPSSFFVDAHSVSMQQSSSSSYEVNYA